MKNHNMRNLIEVEINSAITTALDFSIFSFKNYTNMYITKHNLLSPRLQSVFFDVIDKGCELNYVTMDKCIHGINGERVRFRGGTGRSACENVFNPVYLKVKTPLLIVCHVCVPYITVPFYIIMNIMELQIEVFSRPTKHECKP